MRLKKLLQIQQSLEHNTNVQNRQLKRWLTEEEYEEYEQE
jgi:hypothetical protein